MSSFDEDLKEIQDEKRRNGYYSNQPYMDNTLDTSLNNKRKDPYFDKSFGIVLKAIQDSKKYTNDNDPLTLAGAFALGAGQTINDSTVGLASLILDNARASAVESRQKYVDMLKYAGISNEEAEKRVPASKQSDFYKNATNPTLALQSSINKKLNGWQNDLLGDNPTPLANMFHGSGTSVGYMAGMALHSYLPVLGYLLRVGGEGVAEASRFLLNAYDNGLYDKDPDAVTAAANKVLGTNAAYDAVYDRIAGPFSKMFNGIINPYMQFGARTVGELSEENLQEPTQDTIQEAALNSLTKGTNFLPELAKSTFGIDGSTSWLDRAKQLWPEVSGSTMITRLLLGLGGISTPAGRRNIRNQLNRSKFNQVADQSFKDNFDISSEGIGVEFDENNLRKFQNDTEMSLTLQELGHLTGEINEMVNEGNYNSDEFKKKQARLLELKDRLDSYAKSPEGYKAEQKRKLDEQHEQLLKDRDEIRQQIENFGVPYTAEKVAELNKLRNHLANVESTIANNERFQGKSPEEIVSEKQSEQIENIANAMSEVQAAASENVISPASEANTPDTAQNNVPGRLSDEQLFALRDEYNRINDLIYKEKKLRDIRDNLKNPNDVSTDLITDHLDSYAQLLDRLKEIDRVINVQDVEGANKLIAKINSEAHSNSIHDYTLNADIAHNTTPAQYENINLKLMSEKEAENVIRERLKNQLLEIGERAVGNNFYTLHYYGKSANVARNEKQDIDEEIADVNAMTYIGGLRYLSEYTGISLAEIADDINLNFEYSPLLFAIDKNGVIYISS